MLQDMDTGVLNSGTVYKTVKVFDPLNRGVSISTRENVTTVDGELSLTGDDFPDTLLGRELDLTGWTEDGSNRFHATGVVVDG